MSPGIVPFEWLWAYWPGPLVDEVEGAWDTPMWPAVAAPDWTWEGLKFCVPPYYVPEDGLPWRKGRDTEYQPIRVTKGKGKGKLPGGARKAEEKREIDDDTG
eukprot:gnl/TRDRNA2_/TRDRNA2_45203_c0_seq1.p1 gnl/TRDRNA2_/TRDRNA2_45203_c0~~gnl/TRDRNA2_/TRDRNA2_45203_c0_seq1.p1  ORF type:complete len:102 (-),score=18.96 gnl/TRDRNA2_/TRDRNA2_45203_c0_seq1:114-419(-)